MNTQITSREYGAFQKAYAFFNKTLFADALPEVLVTLQRQANTKGYFGASRFNARVPEIVKPLFADGEMKVGELALNPDYFTGRTDREILSTLVHEMVHIWQHAYGEQKSKGGYHNREWAAKMKEVGLFPSSTGGVGGKETGSKVTHYILDDGAYTAAYDKLAKKDFHLNWQSAPHSVDARRKRESKTKFTCPKCDMNVWGKPDVEVTCTKCQVEMIANVSPNDTQSLGRSPS